MGKLETKEFVAGRGYSQEDWDEVDDNPEWTEEDFRNAKPFAEVFPEWAAAIERDKQTVAASGGRRAIVSIILDVEVLEKLQAEGGDWKARVNDILKKAFA